MKRGDLLDNLTVSCERGEVVTLTLRPLPGRDRVQSGQVVAIGDHYVGRSRAPQVVFRVGDRVVVIGLTMILDFQVGRPPAGAR